MAEARAKTKYLRISPQKARLVARLIQGLDVESARSQLLFSGTKAGRLLLKTLDSAVANAENNFDMRRDNLSVQEVCIDKGPSYRRSKPKNKGGSHPIEKQTSHFTIVVGE